MLSVRSVLVPIFPLVATCRWMKFLLSVRGGPKTFTVTWMGVTEETGKSAIGVVWQKMPTRMLGVWGLLVLEVACMVEAEVRIIPIALELVTLALR